LTVVRETLRQYHTKEGDPSVKIVTKSPKVGPLLIFSISLLSIYNTSEYVWNEEVCAQKAVLVILYAADISNSCHLIGQLMNTNCRGSQLGTSGPGHQIIYTLLPPTHCIFDVNLFLFTYEMH
jgi:hypothetical protein